MPKEAAKKGKEATVKKAKDAAKKVLVGTTKTKTAVRSKVHFYRPKTQVLRRAPKYSRKAIPTVSAMDNYQIIISPIATDSAMAKIEKQNTLVLLCDVRANKRMIKQAAMDRYQVKVLKVNTLVRPDGKKKAYVKLSPESDALDVASKIGVV